jgi:hypothetical protein
MDVHANQDVGDKFHVYTYYQDIVLSRSLSTVNSNSFFRVIFYGHCEVVASNSIASIGPTDVLIKVRDSLSSLG